MDKSYDEEPVLYCQDCLSLKVRGGRFVPDYCDECSSTRIGQCSITEWEEKFKERNGYRYLDGKPKGPSFEELLERRSKYGRERQDS